MNEEFSNGGANTDMEDSAAHLIRLAGPRENLDAERDERIHAAVYQEWLRRSSKSEGRTFSPWIGLAAAASLIGSVVVALWLFQGGFQGETVLAAARVEFVVGEVWQLNGRPIDQRTALQRADRLPIERAVETGQGRAALRLASGHSLRIDEHSLVRFDDETGLVLERGALYVDSGGASGSEVAITVGTVFGDIREIGTQFAVRLFDDRVQVRVREGRVELNHEDGLDELESGRQAILNDRGELVVGDLATYGSDWEWVADATPAYSLEGRTLDEYLAWLSRETGLAIEDPAGRLGTVGTVVLHGKLPALRPLETAEIVLPSCDLQAIGGEGILILRPAGE